MDTVNQIQKLVNEARRDGYERGLREGIQALRSTLLRWQNNHKLIAPHSVETLVGWSEQDIQKLEQKLEEK